MTDEVIEAALRRDRAIVAGALFVLAGLAWAYVLWLAGVMDMSGMDMSGFRPDRRGSDDACERALLTIITAHIAKTNANSVASLCGRHNGSMPCFRRENRKSIVPDRASNSLKFDCLVWVREEAATIG